MQTAQWFVFSFQGIKLNYIWILRINGIQTLYLALDNFLACHPATQFCNNEHHYATARTNRDLLRCVFLWSSRCELSRVKGLKPLSLRRCISFSIKSDVSCNSTFLWCDDDKKNVCAMLLWPHNALRMLLHYTKFSQNSSSLNLPIKVTRIYKSIVLFSW